MSGSERGEEVGFHTSTNDPNPTTLAVVQPTSNGSGFDEFALVWDKSALYGPNGSGRSPRRLTVDRFAALDAMPTSG